MERAKQVTMTDLNAAIGVRQPSARPFPPLQGRAEGLCPDGTSRAPAIPGLSPLLPLAAAPAPRAFSHSWLN